MWKITKGNVDKVTGKTVFTAKDEVSKNVIDTYVINDNIVSVKVTSSVKNLYEDNYTKTVTLYNYDTKK